MLIGPITTMYINIYAISILSNSGHIFTCKTREQNKLSSNNDGKLDVAYATRYTTRLFLESLKITRLYPYLLAASKSAACGIMWKAFTRSRRIVTMCLPLTLAPSAENDAGRKNVAQSRKHACYQTLKDGTRHPASNP